MFAKSYGAVTLGVDGKIIDVEVDVANGLPSFDIVGLPDAAVKEAKERVRTAIKNSGIQIKPQKIMVNLAPANIRKDSSGLDLPIAMGLLVAYGIIPSEALDKNMFTAELSLEGELRAVNGVLPITISAYENKFSKIFVAKENTNEALLVDGITVYGISNLRELVDFFNHNIELLPATAQEENIKEEFLEDDFSDVGGQFLAKRALEIAAAGGHNVLMVGSPGAGKTMLARRLNSILPPMTRKEALEVTKIYSIAGLLKKHSGLVSERPFRSPHHTTSATAMIGGGTIPRPGEVTLSHYGVLFLDELPEFSKSALEVLRQPLEDAKVTISRVNASLTFPAQIVLVAAMNPCPCGYEGDEEKNCTCTPSEIKRYTRKISGPLLDRIDIHIRVLRVEYKDLTTKVKAESSYVIRERVTKARKIQLERFKDKKIFCNAQMSHALMKKFCPLSENAKMLLEQVFITKNLSARSYDRIIKVARTIADLANSKTIEDVHIAEAVKLRNDLEFDIY